MPKRKTILPAIFILPTLIAAGWLIYQIPPVQDRLAWRVELARTYLRGVIFPAGPLPTPLPTLPETVEAVLPTVTSTQAASPTPEPTLLPAIETPTPTPTRTPLPSSIVLASPDYMLQDINNCGPASLAMNLNFYGWQGDQQDIAEIIKPIREDRNVNVEEMVYFVRTRAGWLNAEFRVGGDLELAKQLVAASIPVVIEESFTFEEYFWPNDDRWAAHYLLITGYDDALRVFIAQDSFYGPDMKVSYQAVDEGWKIFNRVYLMIYLPAQEATVRQILGNHWDVDFNRQRALETARGETQANPQDAYAWFNLGSNLVYFGEYAQAAQAFDQARTIGLPQRMLRYQFSPFFAYFHTGRIDDLLALTEYALQRTPNSEEALLWNGWGLYRKGKTQEAIEQFRKALQARPDYPDAQYALDFLGATP